MKNIQNVNAYKKSYTNFCPQTPSSSQKGYALSQMDFSQFSLKIMLFSKNLFYDKTSVTWFMIKKVLLIFSLRRPLFLKNGQMSPQNSFLQFPQKILFFPKKLFKMKILCI